MTKKRLTPPPVGRPIRTENGLLTDINTSEIKNTTNKKPSP